MASRTSFTNRNVNGAADALARLRGAAKVGDIASGVVQSALKPVRALGFPYRAPTVPKGAVVEPTPDTLGANYDTEWARRPAARLARRAIVRGPMRGVLRVVTQPEVVGLDRLDDLTRQGDDARPVIFTPNHHSHLDTPLMATFIPQPWRKKLVVAAAADYFFDKRWKAVWAALAINAIPIDRDEVGRKSSDRIRRLIADGYSLVIYPEGGRSPDGWGQEFKGGAAYMAARADVAVVPVFIDGTGAIFGKGTSRLKPGKSKIVFGSPLWPHEGENTRRFNARIEAAVTALGDEALTDYWTARRRAATGTSPKLTGPDYNGWRREWALAEHRKLGKAGMRRRQKRRWPNLG
jgi:1-acyl-sn-glycerol-3-phosphate acyltransferase